MNVPLFRSYTNSRKEENANEVKGQKTSNCENQVQTGKIEIRTYWKCMQIKYMSESVKREKNIQCKHACMHTFVPIAMDHIEMQFSVVCRICMLLAIPIKFLPRFAPLQRLHEPSSVEFALKYTKFIKITFLYFIGNCSAVDVVEQLSLDSAGVCNDIA